MVTVILTSIKLNQNHTLPIEHFFFSVAKKSAINPLNKGIHAHCYKLQLYIEMNILVLSFCPLVLLSLVHFFDYNTFFLHRICVSLLHIVLFENFWRRKRRFVASVLFILYQ
jgi:hypothetical protein